MTQRVGHFFSLIFCNLLPILGRCSKFVNHPPHFRTQKVWIKPGRRQMGFIQKPLVTRYRLLQAQLNPQWVLFGM